MAIPKFSRRGSQGFTLFEFVVVTSVVALLSGTFLTRYLNYQELAEKVQVEQTVSAIQISLHLQTLSLIAKNQFEELEKLSQRNPIEALAQPPSNYLGEMISTRKLNVVSGAWFFDSDEKKLIYLVHNGDNFRSDTEPKQIQYGVRIVRGTAHAEGGKGAIEGMTLEALNDFSWF